MARKRFGNTKISADRKMAKLQKKNVAAALCRVHNFFDDWEE